MIKHIFSPPYFRCQKDQGAKFINNCEITNRLFPYKDGNSNIKICKPTKAKTKGDSNNSTAHIVAYMPKNKPPKRKGCNLIHTKILPLRRSTNRATRRERNLIGYSIGQQHAKSILACIRKSRVNWLF